MKQFNFRLQKYLNLKKQQEDIQRSVLSGAQAAYEEEKRKLALIDRRIEALVDYSKTLRQLYLNIEMLLLADTYHAALASEKEVQSVSVEEALARLTVEREKYLALQKDRKLLERLREKLWQKFYQDYLREEQKTLDEIGISNYAVNQELDT